MVRISVLLKRPDGDRRGASASPPRPTGCRTRLRGLAPGSGGERRGPCVRDAIQAAQREMASPPSDGSQSWDKWGPVATPAPIMIPGPSTRPPWGISRLSFPAVTALFFERRRKGAKAQWRNGAKAQRRNVIGGSALGAVLAVAGRLLAFGRRPLRRVFAPLRSLLKNGLAPSRALGPLIRFAIMS